LADERLTLEDAERQHPQAGTRQLMDQPVFIAHARLRMRQRAISESDVSTTLSDYHTRYTDRDGNAVYAADIAGRRLRVVIAAGSQPPREITGYVVQ